MKKWNKNRVWYVINSVCIVSCLLIIYALGKLNRFEQKKVQWNEMKICLTSPLPLPSSLSCYKSTVQNLSRDAVLLLRRTWILTKGIAIF